MALGSNVTPVSARLDAADRAGRHAETTGQFCGRHLASFGLLAPVRAVARVLANKTNVVVGQLRGAVSFTPAWYTAPLGPHVLDVVCDRSEPHMRRIDARADIACMADEPTRRNWTVGELPSNSMGVALPISRGVATACPQPTRINASPCIYVRPETLCDGRQHTLFYLDFIGCFA